MGHIHAELMSQYAEDAKQHDRPWELWQHRDYTIWENCDRHPGWHYDHDYRRKPRMVKIGDIEVPEPCKTLLAYGQEYFLPNVSTAGASRSVWGGDSDDVFALNSNLIHLDMESAILHAKALIEVSKGWWK